MTLEQKTGVYVAPAKSITIAGMITEGWIVYDDDRLVCLTLERDDAEMIAHLLTEKRRVL